jgi:gliding motility-associated lipoprotein GldH
MKKAWIALIVVGFLSGCSSDTVVDEFSAVPDYGWAFNDTVSFDYEITDVEAYYNVYLQMRITKDYPLQNLHVKTYDISPKNKKQQNRYRWMLADKAGKWSGSGIGNTLTYELLVKKNTTFQDSGRYQVMMQPYMRIDTIPEISDIGYRIVKTQQKLK